jgi:hypothetical protein
MGDSATTATSMTAPQHSRFEHDDPLALTDYGLSELRASMASFSDFPMAFGNAYDRPQASMHRGSIVDMDDGNVSAGSGHPHRGSIGSVGHLARDGNHTSPESAAGLGMLLGDALEDGSTLAMKLEDGMLREGADGSQKDRDGQDPPPWSEMKTKAGKERKRLPLACIACRRKKIRCSGEKPACKHCLRSRIPCVYKVTTRKAAPRTDYMAMLDKRLRRMEDRVIKLIPKESLPSVAGVGRSVVKPALPGAPPKTPTANKKRGAEEAFGNDLDEWASPNLQTQMSRARPRGTRRQTTPACSPRAPRASRPRTSKSTLPKSISTTSTARATRFSTSPALCGGLPRETYPRCSSWPSAPYPLVFPHILNYAPSLASCGATTGARRREKLP